MIEISKVIMNIFGKRNLIFMIGARNIQNFDRKLFMVDHFEPICRPKSHVDKSPLIPSRIK